MGTVLGGHFVELIKNITIFLLAGQVVLRFLPEGGYEKYARIIIGVMVLSQLALPLLSLGGFDAEAVFSEALTEYEQEMQRIETQVEQAGLKEGGYAQEGLETALSERLNGFCGEWGIRLTAASFDENGILHVTVERAETEEGVDGVGEIRVGQIRVGETDEAKEGEAEMDAGGREETGGELQNALARELGMEPENLEVVWNE